MCTEIQNTLLISLDISSLSRQEESAVDWFKQGQKNRLLALGEVWKYFWFRSENFNSKVQESKETRAERVKAIRTSRWHLNSKISGKSLEILFRCLRNFPSFSEFLVSARNFLDKSHLTESSPDKTNKFTEVNKLKTGSTE